MGGNLKSQTLSTLITEAEKIAARASATFGPLSPAQINWKHSSDVWSIGQCFDHLITTNRTYFPLFENIAAGEYRRTLWQRVPLLPSLFGRLLISSVSPESARKLKAPKVFKPSMSDVDADIIEEFTRHQDELMRFMKSAESMRPEKIIIPSSISPLVTYSLLDGYRILIAHEKRHFQQAERVRAAEGFPLE